MVVFYFCAVSGDIELSCGSEESKEGLKKALLALFKI